MNVLSSCLGEMKSNLERISTERSDLCLLFKHLQTSFSRDDDNFMMNQQQFNEPFNTNLEAHLKSTPSDSSKDLQENRF